MIIMDVKLNHVYGFDDFHMSFTYPRKLSISLIGEEALEGQVQGFLTKQTRTEVFILFL